MAGHNLLAIRTAIRHFHSDISEKNIIPRRPHTRLGAGTDFREPPRFETANMPLPAMAGLRKNFGARFKSGCQ
jgi:hypothetical protein